MTEKSKKEPIVFKGKYFYGTGRRKTSVARVRIYPKQDKKAIVINGKNYQDYFSTLELRRIIEDCFRVTSTKDAYSVSALVSGGGKRGQAESIRHGIARALVEANIDFKGALRDNGYLTRDPRKKERKKPGLKKARRAPQWQKR